MTLSLEHLRDSYASSLDQRPPPSPRSLASRLGLRDAEYEKPSSPSLLLPTPSQSLKNLLGVAMRQQDPPEMDVSLQASHDAIAPSLSQPSYANRPPPPSAASVAHLYKEPYNHLPSQQQHLQQPKDPQFHFDNEKKDRQHLTQQLAEEIQQLGDHELGCLRLLIMSAKKKDNDNQEASGSDSYSYTSYGPPSSSSFSSSSLSASTSSSAASSATVSSTDNDDNKDDMEVSDVKHSTRSRGQAKQAPEVVEMSKIPQRRKTYSYSTKKKAAWSFEEDEKIKEYVYQFGLDWARIANYLPGRLGKQIRERWINCLNPDLKKKTRWAEAEEQVLQKAWKTYPNRWVYLATLLPGRSANDVKNHWNATQRKIARKVQRGEEVPQATL